MSHQIKINLPNENTSSPIIISWTNPSESQVIDGIKIKQEDELQIITQVITHPVLKKADIISPTRVLRSHRKAEKSQIVEEKKVTVKGTKKSKSEAKVPKKKGKKDRNGNSVVPVIVKEEQEVNVQDEGLKIVNIESADNIDSGAHSDSEYIITEIKLEQLDMIEQEEKANIPTDIKEAENIETTIKIEPADNNKSVDNIQQQNLKPIKQEPIYEEKDLIIQSSSHKVIKIQSQAPKLEPLDTTDSEDDDDENRLIIKEEDEETIENHPTSSIESHISISYPSIDGSTTLQPPVIQISYQFPMDSQTSASSTQIQKHFMLPQLDTINSQIQPTFGDLFHKNLNEPTSSNKRSIQPSTSSTSKKLKIESESNSIPIIPYIPTSNPMRRISSTSSDGSSTTHPFQCKMCHATFRRKIDMIHHLKSHSEAKYECQRCGMKFKFEGYFIKHECITCELCNKTFFLKQQLRNHQRIQHDIQTALYECDLCGKNLRYRHGVLYHMSKTHMKYLEDKYECDVCGKRFKLKESIRLHIKNHESVIECPLCEKKVKRINLNVHMKSVHVTERKFKCRFCKTTFKTKECLKSHIRTHEKGFECTQCTKKFANKSHLKEHIEWHKNPEAYKCKICLKTFSQKYCLKAHIRLHESGHLFPKFKCSLCSYSTDKTENLEKHELKHKRQEENEEIKKNWLKCEKCPVKLKNKLKLATHYWKKHSVMPK